MNKPFMPTPTTRRCLLALAGLTVFVAGCSSHTPDPGDPSSPAVSAPAQKTVLQPTPNAAFDYQLGGSYPPPQTARALSRDRTAKPVRGLYNICYVNAFQTQPGDAVAWWKTKHPELLLRTEEGELVVDEDWDEPLLDISTPNKRTALLSIVGPWIDDCAHADFDAVEPDNLDSYQRSDGLLTEGDAIAFAQLLAQRSHKQGLAIAQKNTTDLLDDHARIGFDFAVVEECAHYDECSGFATAYKGKVFDIEYKDQDFRDACRSWGRQLSITLRDRDVRPAGQSGYIYQHC